MAHLRIGVLRAGRIAVLIGLSESENGQEQAFWAIFV
jgi:hypothetical protein